MTEPSFIYRPLADPRAFREKEKPWIRKYLKRAWHSPRRTWRPVCRQRNQDSRRFQSAASGTRDRVLLGRSLGRPGLDRKTRSLLNLAMLAALNRPHEIKLHVRGALTNGVTKDEIKEVFLQVAIYCGVPAAVDSFRIAREVLKEMDL